MSQKSWKREAIKTLIMIVVITAILVGGFQLLRMYLNADTPFRIISNQPSSMEPNLYYGDIGVIERVPGYEIGIGDVIVFDATHWYFYGYSLPPAPVMHRVVDVKFEDDHFWYKTWGDNRLTNPSPDPGWVSDWQVYGKVIFTIPRVGVGAIWFFQGGYILAIVILTLITVVYVLWELQKEEPFSDGSSENKFQD